MTARRGRGGRAESPPGGEAHLATASGGAIYPSLTIDTDTVYTLKSINATGTRMNCTIAMPSGATIPSGTGNYMRLVLKSGSTETDLYGQNISYPAAGASTFVSVYLPLSTLGNTLSAGANAGTGGVILRCYVGGTLKMQPVLQVKYKAADLDIAPPVALAVEGVKNSLPAGAYYTYIDGIKVTATITTKYGATVKDSALQGTELQAQSPGAGTSIHMINPIRQTGTHSYTIAVTDSRDMTEMQTVSFTETITSYTALSVSMTAERCNSSEVVDPTGTGLQVKIWNNKAGNSTKANLYYRAKGAQNWSDLETNVALANATTEKKYTSIGLLTNTSYEIRVEVTDGIHPVRTAAQVDVPQGYVYLYLNAKDKALGVGAMAGANQVVIGETMKLMHGDDEVAEKEDTFRYGSTGVSVALIRGLTKNRHYLIALTNWNASGSSAQMDSTGTTGIAFAKAGWFVQTIAGCTGVTWQTSSDGTQITATKSGANNMAISAIPLETILTV